ncbi:YceI family protein, partial [Pseudoxanthomonas sp. SGD-10]
MKKLALFLFSAVFLVSCSNNPKGDKAQTTDEVEGTSSVDGNSYQVDPSTSSIKWTGSKVTGSHTGTVAIESGSIILNNGQLAGGDFSIDMKSITNEDLQGDAENKAKLEGHLKSDDFFAVDAHPKANFVITEVKNASSSGADVSGNLTLRGVTKNITFPVS